MLSIPDTSDGSSHALAELDEDLYPAIDNAARRLYHEYRNTVFQVGGRQHDILNGPNDTAGAGPVCSVPQDTSSRKISGSRNDTPTKSRKRLQNSDQDDDYDGEGGSRRPTKISRPPEPNASRRILACPFWKLDSTKHRDCFKIKPGKISHVKQHLVRKHAPDLYCDRCKVIFPDETNYQHHLGQECVLDETATLEGITHQQRRRLSKKSDGTLCESEQWFAMWDIIFPGRPRPSSAYLDHSLSEDICHYREFVERHGPDIITQEIQASGVLLKSQNSEGAMEAALNKEALRRSLDMLFEHWLSSRDPSSISPMSLQLTPSSGTSDISRKPRSEWPETPVTTTSGTSGIGLAQPLRPSLRQRGANSAMVNTDTCLKEPHRSSSTQIPISEQGDFAENLWPSDPFFGDLGNHNPELDVDEELSGRNLGDIADFLRTLGAEPNLELAESYV
jgi:hypothetical protein